VAVFSEEGELASRLSVPPTLIGPLGRGFRDLHDDLRARRQIRELVRARAVDIVHAHLTMSELLVAGSVPRNVPIVASRRGRDLRYEHVRWFRIGQGLAHRRVRLMICNSTDLATGTLERDIDPPPIMVIPNGVDLDRYAPVPLPSEPVIVVVANLIGYKRHDLFLRALEVVARRIGGVRAVLVGDGPERDRLEALALRLGISDRVDFRGKVADPRDAVGSARVAALTSVHEGIPNALLEAMAMGRPCVATAVGGVPEMITDGVEGFLVGDHPEAIADRLIHVLTVGDAAERMGRAARERAADFDWKKVTERTQDVYRIALSGERLPRGRIVV
jgi:glycosyltransferase involved in cell wall biosynthesis